MSSMNELSITLAQLAEGEPVTAQERATVRAYLDHLDAEEAGNAREVEKPATVGGGGVDDTMEVVREALEHLAHAQGNDHVDKAQAVLSRAYEAFLRERISA